jgi:hypothetical protein
VPCLELLGRGKVSKINPIKEILLIWVQGLPYGRSFSATASKLGNLCII